MLKLLQVVLLLLFLAESREAPSVEAGLRQDEDVLSKESVQAQITQGITEIFKHIEPPTLKTSISEPVCRRTFSPTAQIKVSELKNILQSNKQSQKCSAPTIGTLGTPGIRDVISSESEDRDDMPRKRRNTYPCNLNNMTPAELSAREDLNPTGINPERICVQQEECVEAGSTDTNTGTINMCRTCKYFVYLPSR